MKESIIVIDNSNKIIKFNESFAINFSRNTDIKINSDVSLFVNTLQKYTEDTIDSANTIDAIANGIDSPTVMEIKFLTSESKKSFSVNIQPIFSDQEECIGRIVSFNDITDYRTLLDQLNQKNNDLANANIQLKEYASTVEELTLIRERNRLARDVHDTLGHSMTLLIALLEVSVITCKRDTEQTEEKLLDALKVSRDGLKELRRSISGLAPEKLEVTNLLNSLKKLIEDYKPSGMHIELLVEGIDGYRDPEYSDVLYRTCQESLTNSLRHGKATQVSIILRFVEGWVKLFIFDNGQGCQQINKGFGLKGMEQRINDLEGNIVYGSDGESGFNIHVEIPMKG